MMKPLTLLVLVGAFTAPLYGAEAVSAAVSSDAPAASASAPTANSAAVATAPVSAATPAPSEAVPVLLPDEPVTPVASSGEGAAPLPKPAESAAVVAPPAPLAAGELQAVPLYRQDELLNWIEQGRHLTQVKQDRCQLTQDIEARASVMKIPAYQFLWGDMLAWGVCTKPNAELGVQYMWEAANQGLAPALEQLQFPYLAEHCLERGEPFFLTRIAEGPANSQTRIEVLEREMLLQGMGSPLDYEDAYRWLHGSVIGDKALHQKAATLLNRLGNRMPANVVARAKAMH